MQTTILTSKTLWLAVITAGIGILQAVPQDMLTTQQAGIITSILGVLIFINRFFTSTAIKV